MNEEGCALAQRRDLFRSGNGDMNLVAQTVEIKDATQGEASITVPCMRAIMPLIN